MELSQQVIDTLLSADSKAFATIGPNGPNVVPVSTIRIVDGKIWLMNYFFKKTLENLLSDPNVSLVGWKGFDGFQIQGKVLYLTSGSEFQEAKIWVAEQLPDRVVKGLLVLTPEAVYNVSPTSA